MTDSAQQLQPARARRTDYLPLDSLREDPANPKEHDTLLMNASVGRFGFIEPMVLDERTGYLISGHGRRGTLIRIRDGGEAPPEGVELDEDGSWLVPVVRGWASNSDTEALAALAALNRIGERGGWDDADLLTLLDEIAQAEDGLVGVGFSESDHAVLRRLAEAEAVYSIGIDSMVDEFRGISGQDPADYAAEYALKVTVYIKDQEAIDDFRDRLGLTEVTKAVNYPVGWTPNDRRRYPD
jgi:hypothetical protein